MYDPDIICWGCWKDRSEVKRLDHMRYKVPPTESIEGLTKRTYTPVRTPKIDSFFILLSA
jgi:hypothetical protein